LTPVAFFPYRPVVTIDSRFGYGAKHFEKPMYIWISGTLGVHNGSPELPQTVVLRQNYPNPFNPVTIISFELPRASQVNLTVYDILGREIAVLVNDRKNAGIHQVKFDGSDLASGVYFYRIQTGTYMETRKLLLMR